MSLLRACSLILLLPSLISPVFAEDAHLVGCKEVSCPKQGADDRCTLEDNTFLGIGISTIPNLPSPLGDLSLMKGVNVSLGLPGEGNDKPTRAFKSNYYLAVPENIKSSELSGCAVMFNDPPKKKFKGREGNDYISNTQAATGTCADVLEETCIEAINAHARNATENGDGNVCDRLKRELKRDSFDSCKGFGGQGSSLGDFTVRSLSDLDAVKNSSDCWPVQQKSDQLMGIAEIISHVCSHSILQTLYGRH
jgi:hypothetical protein